MASSLKIVPFLSFSFLKNEKKKKKGTFKSSKDVFPSQGTNENENVWVTQKGYPFLSSCKKGLGPYHSEQETHKVPFRSTWSMK